MSAFRFLQFDVEQDRCAMKIGTDSVLLGAWARLPETGPVLDIGSGTGVLALMAAQRAPQARVYGLELDEVACAQAAGNFERSPWRERLTAIGGAVQVWSQATDLRFEAIICNPPYFEQGKHLPAEGAARRLARSTDSLSFEDLLQAVQTLLLPQGSFSLVLPQAPGRTFLGLAAGYGLYAHRLTSVCQYEDQTPNRLLMELRRGIPQAPLRQNLPLRHAGGGYADYTQAYRDLVADFLPLDRR